MDAESLIASLAARRETVAVAESTAGGLLTAALIAVPGASAVCPGGVIAYGNRPKIELLSVDKELLRVHGAVSPECAAAMAEGVRALFGTTWGLAETGIAGPSGGTAEKPAGTVFGAVAGPSNTLTLRWLFHGPRQQVMQQVVDHLLALLKEARSP